MKDAILIIGTPICMNEPFLEYIFEKYTYTFGKKSDTFFSPKTDSNLPFLIEKLSNKYDKLTIFAHKDSFILANKIISTLNHDVLILKDEILLPSKVSIFEKKSYLIDINSCIINVLEVEENKNLPNILHLRQSDIATLHLFGFDEESCSVLLDAIKQTNEVTTVITPIVEGWLQINAKAKTHGNIDEFCKNAKELFHGKIFIAHDPINYLVSSLKQAKKSISVAESCTGGLISSLLTKVSGASEVFEGSLISYSNRIKHAWLGVDEGVLNSFGAVSEECVKEMLNGVLSTSEADFALAVSGIAGPEGGSENKPVGTVFIGAARKEGNFLVERLYLHGDRHYIQKQSSYATFKLLFRLAEDIFF